MYRKGAFAIITDAESNLLIVQKHSYRTKEWTLVGGGREPGETGLSGILREVKEETGLGRSDFASLYGPSSVIAKYKYPDDLAPKINSGKYIGQEYDFYALRLDKVRPSLTLAKNELRSYRWIKLADMSSYLIFPGQYHTAAKAVKELMGDV